MIGILAPTGRSANDFFRSRKQAPCILEKLFYHGGLSVLFGSSRARRLFYLNHISTMKKFFALCSMVVALGFVAGCGNGGAPAPAPSAPASYDAVEEYTAEETEAAGDEE